MTKYEAINSLSSYAANSLAKALNKLEEQGVPYYISEARRTLLTQCLYALQGRLGDIPQSDLEFACKEAKIRPPDKNKITWTLRSSHLSGNAVDIIPVKEGKPDWNNQDEKIVTAMKSEGFIWGGDWATPDKPHFELRNT